MEVVWECMTWGDVPAAGSRVQRVTLEVTWQKRLLRWDSRQCGRCSSTDCQTSLSGPICNPNVSKRRNQSEGSWKYWFYCMSTECATKRRRRPTPHLSPRRRGRDRQLLLSECALGGKKTEWRGFVYTMCLFTKHQDILVSRCELRLIPLSNLIIQKNDIARGWVIIFQLKHFVNTV